MALGPTGPVAPGHAAFMDGGASGLPRPDRTSTLKTLHLAATCLLGVIMLQGCEAVPVRPAAPVETVHELYWSDGDSGRIDGTRFRLADIDAPETGAVGSRSGARCEDERQLGQAAKTYMIALTRNGAITVSGDHGTDRYGRRVLQLSLDGRDLARTGTTAGHLRPWPHRNGRAQTQKPDWCD